MSRLRFLLHYIYLYKFSYLLGILFIAATNWIAVNIPIYLKLSIDLVSEGNKSFGKNQDLLLRYLFIMFLLAISIIFVRTLSRIFFFNPGRSIEYQIKNDLFRKLTLLQKGFYDENPSGSIISKIQNDINGVRMICGFGMMQVFNIITALSFTPYKMWQLSPKLTIYVILPIIVVFIAIRIGMYYMIRFTRTRMTGLQDLSSFIVSSLAGIDVIKIFSMKLWSLRNFEKLNQHLLKLSIKISFIRAFIIPLLTNLENILKMLILAVGGLYVINGGLSIGDLTAFIAYVVLLTMPIMGLGWLTTIFETGMVGIASLETIFSQKTPGIELQDLEPAKQQQLFDEGLLVKNLSYTYPGHEEPALRNISFEIFPNQTVGIFGQIGSGKTTLVNCLNRYLDVDPGAVFLGDHDISKLSYADVRSAIRTVSQDLFLFSDTIENNIIFGALGRQAVTQDQIDKVIVESALSGDINRFPDNLNTIVGEKGIMLSGGQKQRISLARSMIASYDLLILDNILSAVDYDTEHLLLKYIHKRETSRSLLIVSHRVRALENANQILVLVKGEITDRGTHQELIERPGLYRDTWQLQHQAEN